MSANGALFIDDNPAPGPGLADPATGRLALPAVLDGLLADGLISAENHQILTSVRTSAVETDKNALQVVADSGWDNRQQPGQKLHINALIGWLSNKTGVPVRKIDPLNTDVQSCTRSCLWHTQSAFRLLPLKCRPTVW